MHAIQAPEEPRLPRLRFVTSHPRDIGDDLIRTVTELPRICKHFHMPAQSGSTRILDAMRRGYTRERYEETLARIRDLCPEALVTSDFIVGFPGETEEDFQQTLDLVQRAEFQNAYIFKYSPRPGTPAAAWPDDVPAEEKKRRNAALLAAQQEVGRKRSCSLIGTRQEILVEEVSERDARRLIGRTSANLIAVFEPPALPLPSGARGAAGSPSGEAGGAEEAGSVAGAWAGKLVTLEIVEATALTLIGRYVGQ